MISLCRQPSIALPLCPLQEQQVSWLEQAVSQACDAIFSSAGLCVSFSFFFPFLAWWKLSCSHTAHIFMCNLGEGSRCREVISPDTLKLEYKQLQLHDRGKIHLAPEVLLPPLYPTPKNQVNIGQQEDKFNYLLPPPPPFSTCSFWVRGSKALSPILSWHSKSLWAGCSGGGIPLLLDNSHLSAAL